MKYLLLTAKDSETLSKRVQEKLDEGWILRGDTIITSGDIPAYRKYGQVVVKP